MADGAASISEITSTANAKNVCGYRTGDVEMNEAKGMTALERKHAARTKLEMKFWAAMHQAGIKDEWAAQEKIHITDLVNLMAAPLPVSEGAERGKVTAEMVEQAVTDLRLQVNWTENSPSEPYNRMFGKLCEAIADSLNSQLGECGEEEVKSPEQRVGEFLAEQLNKPAQPQRIGGAAAPVPRIILDPNESMESPDQEYVGWKKEVMPSASKVDTNEQSRQSEAAGESASAQTRQPSLRESAGRERKWSPLAEVIRGEMMRRFANKLSMEEIADFAYAFVAGDFDKLAAEEEGK